MSRTARGHTLEQDVSRRLFGLTATGLVTVLFLVACSDDSGPTPADGGVDAAADADGAGDAVVDAGPDAAPDAGPDADPAQVITCNNPPLTPPAVGTCSVAKGTGSGLLLAGTVLAPDAVYENGQVLVSGTKIVCVGCDCSGEPAYQDASRVDCAKGVITPGLINPHDHLQFDETPPAVYEPLYDHRHEWRKGQNGKPKISQPMNGATANKRGVAWSELRQLLAGTTSIMGVDSAWGFLRNLDSENTEGLSGSAVAPTFPLGDTDGEKETQTCDYPELPWQEKVVEYKAYVPHVAEGINDEARNELICLDGGRSTGVDVALSTATFIHAMALTAGDALGLAHSGTGVNWNPRGNISLYGMTADVVMLKTVGVKLSLGTDWTRTSSMSLLRELACANDLNETYYDGRFSARDLWLMVTAHAADATGFGNELGRLQAGHVADIAVFDGAQHARFEAITRGSVKEVALVMRGGTLLYGDDAVVAALGDAGCEALDICGAARRVCVVPEIGETLAQLEQQIVADRTAKGMTPTSPYALYFCGAPDGEPSCVPHRSGAYDGTITADDSDGDGVKDAADTCPKIFNPPRPMNGMLQPDTDGDKLGDECDPCPLDANTTTCKTLVEPVDRDGDGVFDDLDNCPDDKNGPGDAQNQTDTDGDGVGDLCDPCPTTVGACPRPIKELRDPSLGKQPAVGDPITIAGVVVTAIRTTKANNYGFYVREGKGPFEAVFVFTKTAVPADDAGAPLKVGDMVDVAGQFGLFNNVVQLEFVSSIAVVGSGDASPVLLKTKDLQPGGASAEGHESQLVRVQAVTVTGLVDAATKDAFWVTDDGNACSGTTPPCAQIGDFFYDGGVKDGKPAAVAGATFASVDGVVNGHQNNHTLDVRSDADLVK
jgi:hypothetical protein